MRHYTRLSSRNFHVDYGFYPLGSCTMKYNPKLHERWRRCRATPRLHRCRDPHPAQGALRLMHELQEALGRDRRPPARAPAAERRDRTASSPACC
jgi:glycine dehydrogenase subunit 2